MLILLIYNSYVIMDYRVVNKTSKMENPSNNDFYYIFRKCITTMNGRRICKTDGSCFKIRIKKSI